MGEAARILEEERRIIPLEEVLKPTNQHLRLVKEYPAKANKDLVLKRQTIGKLFLQLEKIIPSLKKLEDNEFHYTPIFAANRDGFFGVNYNPFTREISGYIIDKTQPNIGLGFSAIIENQLFGQIAQYRLKNYRVIGSLEENKNG